VTGVRPANAPAPATLPPQTAARVQAESTASARAEIEELSPTANSAEPVAAASPGATTEIAAVRPPRPDTLAIDPESEIDDALKGYGCARVSGRYRLPEGGDGEIVLSGHVRTSEERDDLLRRLSAIPGVARLDAADLHLVGEPYCRVLAFLGRPELVRSTDQQQGLAAFGDPAQSSVMRFFGGMPFKFNFGAPEYDSYVYVDYFTKDGLVYHLIPAENPAESRFRADEKVIVGDGRGPDMTIGPPYGLDLVTAIGSPVPLFERLRPSLVEKASDYLAALAAALERLRQEGSEPRLEYAYRLIYTAPRVGASH
jgi:hypothetical protein